jgi:hypothetical protein
MLMLLDVMEELDGWEDARDRASFTGSVSSRTVGDMAWAMFLREEEREEDIRRSIRVARLDFLSALSSPFEDAEPAVGGGETALEMLSRLEDVDIRLLIDIGRWLDGDA